MGVRICNLVDASFSPVSNIILTSDCEDLQIYMLPNECFGTTEWLKHIFQTDEILCHLKAFQNFRSIKIPFTENRALIQFRNDSLSR
jgi:hypothetical protein